MQKKSYAKYFIARNEKEIKYKLHFLMFLQTFLVIGALCLVIGIYISEFLGRKGGDIGLFIITS